MRRILEFLLAASATFLLSNCSQTMYKSNGEKIYHTGQNMEGKNYWTGKNPGLRSSRVADPAMEKMEPPLKALRYNGLI